MPNFLVKPLAGLLLMCCSYAAQAETPAIECMANARGQISLLEIRPGFFSVKGRMGSFDPCEPQVKFRLPPGQGKPALMISVHGGGGISDVLRSDQAFYELGMATLVFDAYAMQGLTGRSSLFWARSVTNEARQRMLFATALGAYQWAIQRHDIDVNRIYLFGISNGAAVVANLAALVDSRHVKGVIAEGVTPVGIGLPDEIRVPLLLAFGRLDDYGNPKPDGRRWDLSGDCRMNVQIEGAPPGSAQRCNSNNPGVPIPSAMEWVKTLKKPQDGLEIEYFDDMAHSAFFGPLVQRRATWGSGETLGASLGATEAARQKFLQRMVDFIARHP